MRDQIGILKKTKHDSYGCLNDSVAPENMGQVLDELNDSI